MRRIKNGRIDRNGKSRKEQTQWKGTGISVYAPDDLPKSVRDVLKAMYPKSKYV